MSRESFLVFKSVQKHQKGDIAIRKKTKDFYAVADHQGLLVMRFLDIITSDNGRTREEIPGKGELSATISKMLFELLSSRYVDRHHSIPIKTHYLGHSLDNPAECLVESMAQSIPLETLIRNRAYGSYCSRYKVAEGTKFEEPFCEFTLKDDARDDPPISVEEIIALGIATDIELEHMREVALAVNQILISFFQEIGIELIDFKLVFGRRGNVVGDYTNIRIVGEISPDTCRLREIKTGKILDKDIYRQGLPGLSEAYAAVMQKMIEYDRERNEKRNLSLAAAHDGYGNSNR